MKPITEKQEKYINDLLERSNDKAKEKAAFLLEKGIPNFTVQEAAHCINVLRKYNDPKKIQNASTGEARRQKRTKNVTANHPLQVGDLFACSWGYEQTQVEFFVVQKVNLNSVNVAKVRSESVENYTSMSGRCKPKPDDIIPESDIYLRDFRMLKNKRVGTVYGKRADKNTPKKDISLSFGNFRAYYAEPGKTFYESSYY